MRRAGSVLALLLLIAAPLARAAGTLYFVDVFKPDFQTGHLRAVRSDGSWEKIVQLNQGGARALAVDANSGLVYWSDVKERTINRLRLESGTTEVLYHSENPRFFAFRLALHPATGFLFWGDQSLDHLRCARLDGSAVQTLVRDAHYARGLAIDNHNRIYWIAAQRTGYQSPRKTGIPRWSICRANLDGTGVEKVLEDRAQKSDLALDPARNRLYFIEIHSDTIFMATLDGKNVTPIYHHRPEQDVRSLAVDPATGDLYWSEQIVVNREKIIKRDASSGELTVIGSKEGYGNIASFVFVPDRTSPTIRDPERSETESPRSGQNALPALIGGISHGQGVAGLKIQAAEGRTFQIAFQARSGGRYQVQYSEDLRHWLNAGPPLTTTEAEVWWTDTGPPLTNVHPGQVPARFYRVLRVE